MNNVTLLGRMVRDPEIKYTQTGKVYARFTLAVDRIGVKAGEGVQTADFIPCVCWGTLAERLGNTVRKGQRLLVDRGTISVSSYKDKEGNPESSFNVNVLSFTYIEKKENAANGTYEGIGQPAGDPFDEVPF